MNFLAHLGLSQNDADIQVGNFIADAVRRSQWKHYKPRVVIGIKLHHVIDAYTDSHPIVTESKKRLRPNHGKYSPVVVDILYDHFLACDFEQYHQQSLPEFTEEVYDLFSERMDTLPSAIQRMMPYMIKDNWLLNYGNKEGLTRVFGGMSRRANFQNQMQDATEDLYLHYEAFKREFEEFYPMLMAHVKLEYNKLQVP